MDVEKRLRTVQKILFAAVIAAAAVLVYVILSSLHVKHTTGILSITTAQGQSVISISSADTAARVVGTGSATVRLPEGTYLVAANYHGNHVSAVTKVAMGGTANTRLNFNAPALLPSPESITFNNLDSLVDVGLSTDQETNLQQLFFNYKPLARTVTVTPSSVVSQPHDPESADPFVIDFAGTIDGAAYRAEISYDDLTNLNLTLFDPATGAQLFSQSSATSSPDS